MALKLVVIGGGKMGEALVGGLLAAGWAGPGQRAVAEKLQGRRDELMAGLASRHPGLAIIDEPVPADGAVVAVKPGDVEAACHAVAGLSVPRVLSIAAGVTLDHLERWLGERAVVRAMPNMPAL